MRKSLNLWLMTDAERHDLLGEYAALGTHSDFAKLARAMAVDWSIGIIQDDLPIDSELTSVLSIAGHDISYRYGRVVDVKGQSVRVTAVGTLV